MTALPGSTACNAHMTRNDIGNNTHQTTYSTVTLSHSQCHTSQLARESQKAPQGCSNPLRHCPTPSSWSAPCGTLRPPATRSLPERGHGSFKDKFESHVGPSCCCVPSSPRAPSLSTLGPEKEKQHRPKGMWDMIRPLMLLCVLHPLSPLPPFLTRHWAQRPPAAAGSLSGFDSAAGPSCCCVSTSSP